MNKTKEPVLIWTMGKVGSSSVKKSLRRIGYEPYHIHYIDPGNVEWVRKYLQASGRDLDPDLAAITALIQERLATWRQTGLKIVTSVREPIARTISAYFQNYELLSGKLPAGQDKVHYDILTQRSKYDVPLTWFDKEFEKVIDFDVYAQTFDPARKYAVYSQDNIDILLFRVDLPDQQKEKVLSEFFGEEIRLFRQNLGEDKAYADAYEQVRRRIVIPASVLDDVYGSKYCRHFWTAEEINGFRNFWLR